MAAITTAPTSLLARRLKKAYPQFIFKTDAICRWSPADNTVYFRPIRSEHDVYSLLHELAHALLDHISFDTDGELLSKEVEAWQHAQEVVAPQYGISIATEVIDTALDTYRLWLYKRSLCPTCSYTGLQTKTDTYQCINCRCLWRVNDARQCQLKRHRIKLFS